MSGNVRDQGTEEAILNTMEAEIEQAIVRARLQLREIGSPLEPREPDKSA